jgi:hypothetical protein
MSENEEIIKVAFEEYKKYYLRTVLLEIFGKNKPLDNGEIKKRLFNEIRKESGVFHKTTMSDIMQEYDYIMEIGYLKSDDEWNKITVSEHGLKALREGVLQNMASSAFFGYKSLLISNNSFEVAKTALCYSKTACWITGFALLVALISIGITLCK